MALRSALSASMLLATAKAWTPYNRPVANETSSTYWLPESDKIRGVNLGSHFIVEPWMANDEWNSMGCGGTNDEWKCVEALGQDAADAAFRTHWDTWITRDDIDLIASSGLNTVRVPVGFWIKEDLVRDDEFYPRGGLEYLDRLMGWCRDAGLYVIMDLHGGPGSQYPNQQFTGHGVDYPGFYTPDNYERTANWLEWMAERIHTNENYWNVGMLQVMNEPVHASQYGAEAADMIANFYPLAWQRIRDRERSLGTSDDNLLHIQFMGTAWGAGDPTSNLPSTDKIYFDDHRYYRWDPSIETTKSGYINAACSDNRGENVLMGEWSIAVSEAVENNGDFSIRDGGDVDWYRSFWAAQVVAFERSGGWVYWTWKCNWIGGYNEWRWCYKSALEAGVIPADAGSAGSISPC